MILLLGGTSEALPIARALTDEGYTVLLSTATDLPLRGQIPEGVERIIGMLDEDGMAALISRRGITAVIDATHPYAGAASENAWRACQRMKMPYLAYDRPAAVGDGPDIYRAGDHEEGAALACSFGRPVLLTIGVRNLSPYVSAARKHDVPLVARVLDQPESAAACRRAGLARNEILCTTGPFSEAENLALIQRHGIGVLVTKDSGDAGGVGTKIAAARKARCRIVVINRPSRPHSGHETIEGLIAALRF